MYVCMYVHTQTEPIKKKNLDYNFSSNTIHINEFVNPKLYSTVPKLCTDKLFHQFKKVKKLYWATGLLTKNMKIMINTVYTWVSQKYEIWIY